MLSKLVCRWSWLGAMLGGLTYIALSALLELVFADHWSGSGTTLLGFNYADYSSESLTRWDPDFTDSI